MASTWQEYQEETAAFFRGLGLEAETNVTVNGVRTKHDVDVLVKSRHIGFDVTWLVECKLWATRVTKLHVLALRTIVADVGADRGIIVSEAGFQSGAIEAAALTNVHVSSLAELRSTASNEILSMRLRELYDRAEWCRLHYWEIPKDERIAHGLRPDFLEQGYSGTKILELTHELLLKAFRGEYPINADSLLALVTPAFKGTFASSQELLSLLEPAIADLEKRIKQVETGTKRT